MQPRGFNQTKISFQINVNRIPHSFLTFSTLPRVAPSLSAGRGSKRFHPKHSTAQARRMNPYALIKSVRIQCVERILARYGLAEPSGSWLSLACHGPHRIAVSACDAN
jgi:hypothetical protein